MTTVQAPKPVSPYGADIPIASIVTVELDADTPLQPFEERQLKNLLQQVVATPDRVRKAFLIALKDLDLD